MRRRRGSQRPAFWVRHLQRPDEGARRSRLVVESLDVFGSDGYRQPARFPDHERPAVVSNTGFGREGANNEGGAGPASLRCPRRLSRLHNCLDGDERRVHRRRKGTEPLAERLRYATDAGSVPRLVANPDRLQSTRGRSRAAHQFIPPERYASGLGIRPCLRVAGEPLDERTDGIGIVTTTSQKPVQPAAPRRWI